MARALLLKTNRGGDWVPTAVFLGTRKALQARNIPSDPALRDLVQTLLRTAVRPADGPTGTWEDWIPWAEYALTNYYDRVALEVPPEVTLKALYQREVLGMVPEPIVTSKIQPRSTVPVLRGRTARKALVH